MTEKTNKPESNSTLENIFSKIGGTISDKAKGIDLSAIKSKLEQEYQKRKQSEKLNIILMGATGVGKSSLVNAVFGEEIVQSGAGEPVTQHLKKINIPEKNVTLWDTKGIESKDYEATIQQLKSDIKKGFHDAWENNNIDDAPHVIWLCIKESSARVEGREFALLSFAKEINVPIIIVFTDTQFEKGNETVNAMIKAFNKEYEDFINGRFARVNSVAYEITLPYEIAPGKNTISFPQTGLDQLLEHTGNCLSDARKNALNRIQIIDKEKKIQANKERLEQMKEKANTIVNTASAGAATVGASPIPFSDTPLITAAQTAMIYSLNSNFEVNMQDNITSSLISGVLTSTAIGQIGRTVVSNALKFIPGVGSIAGAAISGTTALAITQAIGRGYTKLLVEYYNVETGKVELPSQIDTILSVFKDYFTDFYKKK